MATTLWQRQNIGDDLNGVKNTFSSWDSCMSKAYCKWPVIVAIIVGSLIVLSVIFCLARCICCGAECCCGCLSCCTSCCRSGGGRRRPNDGYGGYQQPPPQHYPPYNQYAPPTQPPVYASGGLGYRGPETASFIVPSNKPAHDPDSLPAFPGWASAKERQVEVMEHDEDDVEMTRLNDRAHQQQTQSLLQQQPHEPLSPTRGPYENNRYDSPTPVSQQDFAPTGDVGSLSAAPYHDYNHHQQFVPSPYGSQRTSAYPPTYHTHSPVSPTSTAYGGFGSMAQHTGYEPSVPPSYHSQAVSPIATSPPPQGLPARKPVQGSWREV